MHTKKTVYPARVCTCLRSMKKPQREKMDYNTAKIRIVEPTASEDAGKDLYPPAPIALGDLYLKGQIAIGVLYFFNGILLLEPLCFAWSLPVQIFKALRAKKESRMTQGERGVKHCFLNPKNHRFRQVFIPLCRWASCAGRWAPLSCSSSARWS